MSPVPRHPDPDLAATESAPAAVDPRDAQERADIEEDRRRQRDLDDAELGGES